MNALRLTAIGQPLELQNIPMPRVGPDKVLVRVEAAGICHSDVHYRAGTSPVGALPQTLGHEVAGTVEDLGEHVHTCEAGDRVCIHYQLSCGHCYYCSTGNEQFCQHGHMIGKHCDGGYAEYLAVPARNVVPLPDTIPFSHGAVLMCAAATSLHALRKARVQPGETVAVFGTGGLGLTAVQLAPAFGAGTVYAVDINPRKLELASSYGAVPVNAGRDDPVEALHEYTKGRGIDVALELVGLPETMQQAVRSLAIFGRAAIVGIGAVPFPVDSYRELIGKEAEIMGAVDHLLQELPLLLDLVETGKLDLTDLITASVRLDASEVNTVLDGLAEFDSGGRTVILPHSQTSAAVST